MKRILFFTFLFYLNFLCFAQKNEHEIQLLFEEAKQLRESGKKDSARMVQLSTIKMLAGIVDSTALVRTLIEEGKDCEQKGHYELALVYYIQAINSAKHTHQRTEEGMGYLGLSNVNFRIGNNSMALANSIEAVTIFKQIGDTKNYITASMLTAQMFIILTKYDDALAIYQEMLDLAENVGDSIQIADNLDHIGVIYSFREQYEEALPYHQKALLINKKIKNQINQSINYANIGEIFIRLEKYDEAIVFLKSGLAIAAENDFRSLQIFIYYTLGEAYSILGKQGQAESSFEFSLKLIEELGEYREKSHVYHLLSQHYERKNDLANALSFYKKYSEMQDSLQTLDVAYKTEELKIIYELDKQEQELKAVTLEKQLQQSELLISKDTIRLQFIVISLVALGMVFTTLFGFYFYRSQRQLRQANNTKNVLFSIIGHDLRGPVGNMKKLVELFKTSSANERNTIMEMLEKASNSTFELLNELLEWSKSIQDKMKLHPTNFQLATTVMKAAKVVEIQATNKTIDLQVKVSDNIQVYADVDQIFTVLRNLISNAIKFTLPQGAILIEVEEVANNVTIKVSDNGIGIEAQALKKILSKDFVVSTYGTNKEKGSGLGLLLCQEFLKANGSHLHAHSKPGEGSTFYFTLPKGK